MHYEAIVIGGGAAGLSAALGLQSSGVEVLCVAPEPLPALTAAAGMLLPALDDFSPSIQRAAHWSYAAWPEWAQSIEVADGLKDCLVRQYLGDVPSLVQQSGGRVVHTGRLYETCLGQLQLVARDRVVECELADNEFRLTLGESKVVASKSVFWAVGYSEHLPVCHGFEIPQALVPRSVRGITLRCRLAGLDEILYWKKDARTVIYVAPWDDGTVVVGSTISMDDTDQSWRANEEQWLIQQARIICPGIDHAEVLERRVGLRPLGHSREPAIVQLLQSDELRSWWINGLFRNGVLWMPACARASAALYQGCSLEADLTGLLQLDRADSVI